ncbi:hypothetical protein F511_31554 [Dorcoceras hygrometricum]|uniref:Dystroglycan-like n=1 Tax=Dorcoceras hygrometricum TaxID=472368 RepID=A0A2Z7CS62_9LAMI|nr:hypothetical protein F511_31554 [Dorcoceras hygrometricum]
MASSLIANAIQINFDSFLGISDNDGLVNMFKALEASGLRGFLGCPSTLYERELEQFFNTDIVQEGDITCAVLCKYVAISESRFAGVFGFPTKGLTDISTVPKDLVYDARSIFSQSGEPVSFSCKKRLLKYEYRFLNDILAKSLTVKAGSFDAVTHERFPMMTVIHFVIKVNWSKILFEVLKEMVDKTIKRAKGFSAQICVLLKGDPAVTLGDATIFPQLKILSANTVSTYVSTNKTIDSRGEIVEPGVAKVAIVRKKSISKKKSAPTDEDDEPVEIVAEKSRVEEATSCLALDVVPIQTVDPTSAMPASHPPAPKRKAPKRKLRMTASFDDEFVEKESAVETVVVEQKVTTSVDDVDTIIGEVIAATEQLETDVVESDSTEDFAIRTDFTEQVEPRSDDIIVEVAGGSTAVTDEEVLEPLSKVLETTVSPIFDDESLTIEEHLAQIPEGMMLPSLTSAEPKKMKFCNEIEIRGVEDGDWYRAHLPKIAANDKGKKSLKEPDTVQGHPAREYLRNLKDMRSVKDILSKEEKMLAWAETDSLETAIQRRLLIIAKYREVLLRKFLEARRTNIVPGLPTTAIDQRTLDLLLEAHQQAVRNLLRKMRAHGLKCTRLVSSMLFEEPNLERDFYIPRNHKTIFSTCWLRNLRKIEGSWVVEPVHGMDSQRPFVKTWGWFKVCTYIIRYSMFGCLRPVGSFNFCTDLVPVGSVFGENSIPQRIVDYVSYRIQILDSVLPYFSVQISPVVDITSAPTNSVLPSPHQSSTFASSMHFTDDILQGTETAVEQILEPSTSLTATAFTESFAQLRDSISQISIKQVRTQRSLDDIKSELLFKIDNLAKASAEARDQQTQSFQNSIKSVHQEARTQGDVLSVFQVIPLAVALTQLEVPRR